MVGSRGWIGAAACGVEGGRSIAVGTDSSGSAGIGGEALGGLAAGIAGPLGGATVGSGAATSADETTLDEAGAGPSEAGQLPNPDHALAGAPESALGRGTSVEAPSVSRTSPRRLPSIGQNPA